MRTSLPSFGLSLILLTACGTSEPPPVAETAVPVDTTSQVTEPVATEVAAILITEHKIGDVHMNHAHHEAKRQGKPTDTIDHSKPYETVKADDLNTALAAQELTPLPPAKVDHPIGMPSVVVTSVTEVDHAMLVSYEKKGVEVLQVTTDPDDPQHVEHGVFTHKNHTDEYDVTPGMKGHEARKLRKELKHMSHKGQVFLYEEDSNITYRMKVIDPNKNTYNDVEVNELEIEAIVWRNQHDKKDKKKSVKG
jgi:hypothetical protein